MNLLISKDKAIKILQDRIFELNSYNFNAEAWKERTVLDLKEIFGILSTQYMKIQFLRFDTFVTSEKAKVLIQTKNTAKEILNSYIQFIDEYSKVAEERRVVREKNYEEKYYELMKERNEIVTDYNTTVKNYEEQLDTTAEILDQNEKLTNQIETIKRDTIQIDNVSLPKLSKTFFNLPIWQIMTTLSVVIGIIIGTFEIGKLYQENADNNQLFDYKTEINKLKNEKSNAEKVNFELNEEIKQLKNKIDSLSYLKEE